MSLVSGSILMTPDPVIHFIWEGSRPTPIADRFQVKGQQMSAPKNLVGWKLESTQPKSLDGTTWSVRLVPTKHADRSWLVPSTIVEIIPNSPPSAAFQAIVPSVDGAQRGFDELVGFPLITEAAVGGRVSSASGTGGQALVDAAFQRGLGRKPSRGDVRGMLALMDGAMEQVEQDGIVRWEMRAPGAFITQTDAGAGVTGRQFSLANLAQSTEEEVTPLVEDVKAVAQLGGNLSLLEVYRSNFLASLHEAVAEASAPGGPLHLKAGVLLDQGREALCAFGRQLGMVEQDPNNIGTYVLRRDNVVQETDEEQFTKLLVVVDRYVAFDEFFRAFFNAPPQVTITFDTSCNRDADLGLRFALLDRQLDVIAEAADELTDALRSVGIGRQEVETLRVDPRDPTSATIADLLDWAQRFASREARPLIQGAGTKGGVLLAGRLGSLVTTATTLQGASSRGLGHPRVRVATEKLVDELKQAQAKAQF